MCPALYANSDRCSNLFYLTRTHGLSYLLHVVLVVFLLCKGSSGPSKSGFDSPPFPVSGPGARCNGGTEKEGGLLVGWLCRKWYSLLFHRHAKTDATPTSISLIPSLQDIERTRSLAMSALRNHKWPLAKAYLQEQKRYIRELEALQETNGGDDAD